jgi:hypothetical protein
LRVDESGPILFASFGQLKAKRTAGGEAGNYLFTGQRKLKDSAGGQGALNGASLMSANGQS